MPSDAHDHLPALLEEIRDLLDAPVSGEAAPVAGDLETALTTGYARVLELEAERSRLERRIGTVLAEAGPTEIDAEELTSLARKVSDTGAALVRLRAVLTPLRARLRAARQPREVVAQLPHA